MSALPSISYPSFQPTIVETQKPSQQFPTFSIVPSFAPFNLPPLTGIIKEEKKEPVKIVPRDYQVKHFERCIEILASNHIFIDTSVMGAGKTFNVGNLAQLTGLPLLIVAPKKAIQMVWKEFCEIHGIKIIDMIAYTKLISTKKVQGPLGHGLLYRFDNPETGKTEFHPTDKLKMIAASGAKLIFDESHKMKNVSITSNACTVLAYEFSMAYAQGAKSRIGLLSATPFDKPEHAKTILRVMGFITHSKLYMVIDGSVRLSSSKGRFGAQELIDIANYYNPAVTQDILSKTDLTTGKNIEPLVYKLFRAVIMPTLSSSMPKIIAAKKIVYNYYYPMKTKKGEEAMVIAINDLARASFYDEKTGLTDSKKANYGAIQSALVKIESLMAEEILDNIIHEDMKNPKGKSIIFFKFPTTTLPILKRNLAMYDLLVMEGNTKEEDRPKILKLFQEDPKYRIFLGSIGVAGESLNMDDKVGDQPRKTYIIPDYSIDKAHQASGRTHRGDTKSDATIANVYPKIVNPVLAAQKKPVKDSLVKLSTILTALNRKSGVLKDLTPQQVKDGVKYPGDYPERIYGEPYVEEPEVILEDDEDLE